MATALSPAAMLSPSCQAASRARRTIASGSVAAHRACGWSSKAAAALSGAAPVAALQASHSRSRPAFAHSTVTRVVAAGAAPGSAGTVVVAGATGLVGTALVKQLLSSGYSVKVLTRNVVSARNKLPYPGLQFVAPAQWSQAVCGTAAVVNLAGEPIATRWTAEVKAEVKRSRVAVTSQLAAAINACPADQRPKVLVNSSAVGFYGNSESQTFSEASQAGRDYLAEVCKAWEDAAAAAQTRVVVLRTGIVLAKEGGALGRMIPVFSIFAGGPLGSGRQWCSWIHRDDVVGMILEAINNDSWQGSYNATAPNPVRMGELCSALGSVMGRPSLVPVPDFALRTLLGEGANVVLEGQRVVPTRAQEAGFKFQYSQVGDALRNVLRR
ncbi:hypothetical protein D9Q98_003493 [Chlorella vulgaris]|uniref:Uncharacterized protein n=1 Tax=Chlorella vulgaris TaxID=3077 RepID=A0A9D4YZ04_CHLVU|nr:hypothetical protein D9Q98_003493 [Chlorella vulgaris]